MYKDRINRPKSRNFKERLDPFEIYNDLDFYQRYRFDKASVNYLVATFGEDVDTMSYSCYSVKAEMKILITLRFLASNSLQQVVGDCFGLDKSTVCRIVNEVIPVIASKMDDFVQWPNENEKIQQISNGFKEVTGIPGSIFIMH